MAIGKTQLASQPKPCSPTGAGMKPQGPSCERRKRTGHPPRQPPPVSTKSTAKPKIDPTPTPTPGPPPQRRSSRPARPSSQATEIDGPSTAATAANQHKINRQIEKPPHPQPPDQVHPTARSERLFRPFFKTVTPPTPPPVLPSTVLDDAVPLRHQFHLQRRHRVPESPIPGREINIQAVSGLLQSR